MFGYGRALIFGLMCLATLVSGGLSSEQIFDQVERSVVLVGNEEGFASGVVVSKDGKILTNYHAILSASPLIVKAKVQIGGAWSEVTFSEVEVSSVHKKHDLALLQLKNLHYPLKPLLWPQTTEQKTGSACFVVGNPSNGAQALRNTITAGLISSAERSIDGNTYIQISAAINPGNSGGALVNEEGQLIGIVTFKPVDSEGIGFAIPLCGIKQADFVQPSQRPIDKERAIDCDNKGEACFTKAMQQENRQIRSFLFRMAGYYFHMSLMAIPLRDVTYHNIGLVHDNLGETKLAKTYYEKSLSINTNSVISLQCLGVIYMDEGRKDEALQLWLKGAFLQGGYQGVCAMNASICYQENADFVKAAYLSKLSLLADPHSDDYKKRTVLSASLKEVSEPVRQLLASKNSPADFSTAEMQQLEKSAAQAQADEEKAKVEQQTQTAASRKAYEKKMVELLARQETAANEWVQKKVPRPVVDAVPAYGGMLVALSFIDLGKIGILNPKDASITSFLTPGGNDFLMAAGGFRLVVYIKNTGVLETYDLNTMACVGVKKLPSKLRILTLEMGYDNPDAVFISYIDESSGDSRCKYALIDPLSGRITSLACSSKTYTPEHPNRFMYDSYGEQVRISTDANLNHLARWNSNMFPSGLEYVTLDLNKATFVNWHKHENLGALTLSADGTYVFTTTGRAFKDEAEVKGLTGTTFYRVLSGDYVAAVSNASHVVVRSLPSLEDVFKLALPPQTNASAQSTGLLPPEKRLIISARSQRIVLINPEQAMVYVHPMKLESPSAPAKSQDVIKHSLSTSPGNAWTYDLQLAAGAEAHIADAPKGMDIENGCLRWKVPADAEKKMYEILVSVKSTNGSEDYRVVKLLVQ